jgi:hypothetical protein
MPTYEILADDVLVWTAPRRPTTADIDRTATIASGQGWDGTVFDLYCNGQWQQHVYPSQAALAAAI